MPFPGRSGCMLLCRVRLLPCSWVVLKAFLDLPFDPALRSLGFQLLLCAIRQYSSLQVEAGDPITQLSARGHEVLG